MAIRKISFTTDEFYHIYNRGNSKQEIFISDEDRDRFVKLLFLCNSSKNVNFRDDIVNQKIDAFDFDKGEPIVSIGAWVLMPNHFHLYLKISPRSCLGENSIPVFMQKLSTGYSMYFNKKYARTGSLFEGKYKSIHIDNDNHAKYIFSYIHLNPLKLIDRNWNEIRTVKNEEALEFLKSNKWSSYNEYIGIKRQENKIISYEDFPEYFSDIRDFNNEIFDWLTLNPLGLASGE